VIGHYRWRSGPCREFYEARRQCTIQEVGQFHSTEEALEQRPRCALVGGGGGGKGIWPKGIRFCKTGTEHSIRKGYSMAIPKRAQHGKPQTQPMENACSCSPGLPSAQERIRQKALEDKGLQFTTLWHHIYNVDHLRQSYYNLKRHAAPGIDKVTWQQYGEDLEENLLDLSNRLRCGAYRTKPVRRTYVPKSDGSSRPIGILMVASYCTSRSFVW